MELKIKNKRVLVTASSAGIGKATAIAFLQEGCKVAICSRNHDNISKALNEIRAMNLAEPEWILCDINKKEDIANTVEVMKKTFGGIDILVNNCGGPPAGYFDNLDDEHWQGAFDQVLLSAVRFTRAVLPDMKKNNWGRIINITSISVKQPIDNLILSNALRSAVVAMAKTLSSEVGKYNITINNIAPGYTLTGRLYELAVERAKTTGESHEHVLASMAANVPLNRLARPDEIASLIVFLASELAGYITGTTIQIDGGVIKSLY